MRDPRYAHFGDGVAVYDHADAVSDHGLVAYDHPAFIHDPKLVADDHGVVGRDPFVAAREPSLVGDELGVATYDLRGLANDHGAVVSDHGVVTRDHGVVVGGPRGGPGADACTIFAATAMAASHRFFALFVLVALVVAPRAEAQVASLTDYGPIRDRRLANGLRVIVQEDHRTPIVSLEIRYDAGSRYEPAGREGLARVVLDAMVRATKHVGVHEYGDILLRAGATWSSRVERDYVQMSATLPSSRIELPMWLWSDQMGFFASAFDDKALDETRATVLDSEVKWRDSQPLGRVPLFLDRALYPVGHPYRSSGAATKEGLAALTVADVRAFHERVFVPDRATLVVVGDVKASDAFAYAEKYFGPVPRGLGGAFPFAAPPRLTGETRLSVDAHVSTPSVWIRWPTPAFYAPGDADLDVVARLFSGRSRAHLFWKLVDERKVATAVFAHQSSAALGSSFDLRVTGVAGGDARALLSEVDRALGELVATLLPLDDVRTAENEVTFHMAFNLEKTSERAWAFANFTAYHDDTDYFSTEVGRHGAVTDLTVRTTAKRYLPLDRRIVALVTPSRDAPLGGALIGQELTPAGVK